MWVCHITGTPGCGTSLCSVPLHCTQARNFTRTAEVTICKLSERLPDRSRQLPLHSLTAVFRDLGNASSPYTEDTPDEVREWPANHAPSSSPGCRGHLADHRAREGGEEIDALESFEPACQHMVHAMKCGGDPTQPTYNHQSITDRHQSRPVCKPPLLFSPDSQMLTIQVTKENMDRKKA